jgi:hypothetical protein
MITAWKWALTPDLGDNYLAPFIVYELTGRSVLKKYLQNGNNNIACPSTKNS